MPRILIIDDEKEIREMLRQKLEPEGYQVETAPNGKVGLRIQEENPCDLVITDIFMPEMAFFSDDDTMPVKLGIVH